MSAAEELLPVQALTRQTLVRCDPYRCTLAAGACVDRRAEAMAHREAAGEARHFRGIDGSRCLTCAVGAERAAQLPARADRVQRRRVRRSRDGRAGAQAPLREAPPQREPQQPRREEAVNRCSRRRRHEKGLCAGCGVALPDARWECDACAEIRAVKDHAFRTAREAAGLCRVCGEPSTRGPRCARCRAKERAAYYAQRDPAKPARVLRCRTCGEPGHFAKTCPVRRATQTIAAPTSTNTNAISTGLPPVARPPSAPRRRA